MTAPVVKVERKGVGYLLTWPDWALRAKVSKLKEDKQHLKGDLALHHIVNDEPMLLYHGTFNFSSQPARKKIAKELASEFGYNGWEPNWNLVVEQLYKEVWQRENQAEPLRIITGDPDDYPIDLSYIVYPLVFEGQATIIFGEGGLAKSWFALYCALLASVGMSQNGIRTTQGPIVYIDWETSQEEINRRVWLFKQGGCIPSDAEVLYHRCYRSLADDLEEIVEQVQGSNARMVIIDSLLGASGVDDLEKSQAAGKFFNAFRRLDCAGLLITHTQKGEGKKSVFGSSFWTNQARSVWQATGNTDPGGDFISLGLTHTKVNMGRRRMPLAYRMDFAKDPNDPDRDIEVRIKWEDPVTVEHTQEGLPHWMRIKAEILESTGSISTVKRLSESTGIPFDTVRMNLNRHKDKFVKRGQIGQDDAWGVAYQGANQ